MRSQALRSHTYQHGDALFRRRAADGVTSVLNLESGAVDVDAAAVPTCLANPLPMVASDGAWDGGRTHPGVAGTNSRVLGRYVREAGVLTLMDAIRRMSLAPANHLAQRVPAMRRKGRVQVGADADLVVFDPATVVDRATYRQPTLAPEGIEAVLVTGVAVVRRGVVTERGYPGRPLRGERTR